MIVKCIRCDKSIKNRDEESLSTPEEAIVLEARGNLGSKVWNPLHSYFFRVFLCDSCFEEVYANSTYTAFFAERMSIGITYHTALNIPYEPKVKYIKEDEEE